MRTILLLIFLNVFLIFCSNEKSKIIVKNDLLKINRIKLFYKYEDIHRICNDSIKKWVYDSLQVVKSIFFDDAWRLDSIFVFNQDSNRFFSTINGSTVSFRNSSADFIQEFGGAKIKGKWYFFFIANTMVVPREFYKEDIYEPLTFEELSSISHEEIIGHYVKKRDDGSFAPNDEAFKQLFVDEWYCGDRPCKSAAERDSIILLQAKQKYKYKLKREEIIEIKEEMANSVRPPAPKKKWWKFW